jgi:hypothetical protein
VPTTSGRTRGRQGVHSGAQGAAGDHMRKIMATMVAVFIVIVFVLVMTKAGRDIDAATQHFMLFYAGVFALIGLTGSVMVGLLATDRIVMAPAHRVMAQAVHRAVSFGALVFLVIHIVTEILAQRVHVIDAFIPFLSPFRTFYIGLGTIASDLILLIMITSILRKRFTAHGKAWRWRAIHYASYAAFVFGVLHGLLGGRAAKPYVDWSYGFAIAITALGLAVRFLAISLRSKESVGGPPGADRARAPASAPLHAAALSMAQAQLGGTVQVLPAGLAAPPGAASGMPGSGAWATLPPARGSSPFSGPLPALGPAPAYAAESSSGAYLSYPSAETHHDLGFTPLGAPPYGDDVAATRLGRPYVTTDLPRAPLTGSPGGAGPGRPARRPLYEPEYDGPPRFEGAPRGHVPQDEVSSYPYSPPASGAGGYLDANPNREDLSRPARPRHRALEPPSSAPLRPGDRNTGPLSRAATGPAPRPDTGPLPRIGGQLPRSSTGPMPRAETGPMPRTGTGTGPIPRNATGPMPRNATGPIPRADSGPMPRAGTGPMPRAGAGSMSRPGTGPAARPDTGPIPWAGTGQVPRAGTGPMPPAGRGPVPQPGLGPMPRAGSAQPPRPGTGQDPRMDSGPLSRAAGAMPRAGTGTGSMPTVGTGPMPRPGTGPIPRAGASPAARLGTRSAPRPDAARPDTSPVPQAGTGAMPRTGPPAPPADLAPAPHGGRPSRAAGRLSRRTNSAGPRHRQVPEPDGGDEWR